MGRTYWRSDIIAVGVFHIGAPLLISVIHYRHFK
jgi:hypothetical protein